ncbi:uncharacterized protein LOC126982671 [Eriocheir sinensis]|uniref:uncharacterized protein LOC126982671 n=1 Tax=Eriocheir sinensis TaxID=95602 RepID=UPI0021CA8D7E|nr:uncharacterized protein LOC126982671 [Eriocheir sinensis]
MGSENVTSPSRHQVDIRSRWKPPHFNFTHDFSSVLNSIRQGKGAPSTSPRTSGLIVPVVSAGLVLLVKVLVVLVVFRCMRRRRSVVPVSETSHPRDPDLATPTRASVHGIENILYEPVEPFSGLQTPAAGGHQQGQQYIIENTLYDPFSGLQTPAAGGHQQGQEYVIENTLNEPFSGPQTPAAGGHQGQEYVIENTLLEPFSGPQTPTAGR